MYIHLPHQQVLPLPFKFLISFTSSVQHRFFEVGTADDMEAAVEATKLQSASVGKSGEGREGARCLRGRARKRFWASGYPLRGPHKQQFAARDARGFFGRRKQGRCITDLPYLPRLLLLFVESAHGVHDIVRDVVSRLRTCLQKAQQQQGWLRLFRMYVPTHLPRLHDQMFTLSHRRVWLRRAPLSCPLGVLLVSFDNRKLKSRIGGRQKVVSADVLGKNRSKGHHHLITVEHFCSMLL